MKKVLIDKYIPFDENPFEGLAHTELLAPAEFTPEKVRNADALIVRTRTRCDAPLLEGSKVGIVATATIGTDHFNFPYLASRNIRAVSAPGCNAPAVAQYVLASIFAMGLGQPGMRLGVVGVGHVGSIIASWARTFGMDVMLCDPPRALGLWDDSVLPLGNHAEPFLPLQEIARKADVVTFHTPLTRQGRFPSFHLLGQEFLSEAPKAMVINAARGPVADTQALIHALKSGRIKHAAIDTWEGEPNISHELLRLSQIATPHIAGYSIEGKKRATAATFNAVLEYLGSDRRVDPAVPLLPPTGIDKAALIASYDPFADTELLKSAPDSLETIRDNYTLRHEPSF